MVSVKDSIMNSMSGVSALISGVSSLSTKTDNILANIASISGSASNFANGQVSMSILNHMIQNN